MKIPGEQIPFLKNQTEQTVISLTRSDRQSIRKNIFFQLDGLAVVPIVRCLKDHGALDLLSGGKVLRLDNISEKLGANEGYLNVALRVLCSQGWLIQSFQTDFMPAFQMTDKGRMAMKMLHLYAPHKDFFPYAGRMDTLLFEGFSSEEFTCFEACIDQLIDLKKEISSAENSNDPALKLQREICAQLEGVIAGPALVAMSRKGLFDALTDVERQLPIPQKAMKDRTWEPLMRFFDGCGWTTGRGSEVFATDRGVYQFRRAAAYGVTVSYLPTLSAIPELVFGNAMHYWSMPDPGYELHVDRDMNVWGSGGAHTTYFKTIDKIVIDLFNQPIEKQPLGYADMGSGNGAFLEHLFDLIWHHTKRGKMLDKHPLYIVGSDFNDAALNVTRRRLQNADIWAKVVFGDISDPDGLARDLSEKHNIRLEDLLNVRSFLDHNRIYEQPAHPHGHTDLHSTGAFCYRGKRIPNRDVEQNLVEHLARWKPFIGKFGLLVIELHTLPPQLAAANLGMVPSSAYDATHGFSDQYTVELEVFLRAAAKAGLHADPLHSNRFPDSELATVSINLLRS